MDKEISIDFLKPKLMADYLNYPVLCTNDSFDLKVKFDEKRISKKALNVEINDKKILTYQNEKIFALKSGATFVKVSLVKNPKIFTYFGVLVIDDKSKFSCGAKSIVKTLNMYALQKDIEVYSLEKTYSHRLTQSISSYLFEDLKVIKNIAPKTNKNRTNKLENKKYICIHDTADVEYSALSWNKTVFDNFYEKRNIPYNASYQYVVGNDGIYQNIPDEEIAFHAGDGSEEGFKLIKSGVLGNNINPIITISDDGYYEIDGKKSIISAPKDEDKVLTTLDINNFGIKCEVIGGEYYLGLTWYSKVYKKIANRGGNRNSIGIESCLDEGSNIHLTWQRLAKLVAYLLNKYKLKLRDIVPHQFFSGKLCPHTIIENGCWNYLVELIKAEKNILSLKNKGYSFRIKNQKEIICQKDNILLEYQIEIKKENNKETLKFYSYFTN